MHASYSIRAYTVYDSAEGRIENLEGQQLTESRGAAKTDDKTEPQLKVARMAYPIHQSLSVMSRNDDVHVSRDSQQRDNQPGLQLWAPLGNGVESRRGDDADPSVSENSAEANHTGSVFDRNTLLQHGGIRVRPAAATDSFNKLQKALKATSLMASTMMTFYGENMFSTKHDSRKDDERSNLINPECLKQFYPQPDSDSQELPKNKGTRTMTNSSSSSSSSSSSRNVSRPKTGDFSDSTRGSAGAANDEYSGSSSSSAEDTPSRKFGSGSSLSFDTSSGLSIYESEPDDKDEYLVDYGSMESAKPSSEFSKSCDFETYERKNREKIIIVSMVSLLVGLLFGMILFSD